MSGKQVQSMFGSSIEVLDSLLRQYESRLGLQQEDALKSQDDVQSMFEGFYDRLKFMLQTVCEHLRQYQSTSIQSFQTSYKHPHITYDECLFPQHNSTSPTIIKCPSTDQELYQLVVEMKTKLNEDKEKIISLQQTLTQVKRQNRQLQTKFKALTQNCQHKENQLALFIEKIADLNGERETLATKLKEQQTQISIFSQQIIQLQTSLLEKDSQITNLSNTQRLYEEIKSKYGNLNQQYTDLKTNLITQTRSNEEFTFKLTQFQQTISQLSKQNKKLRTIIAKKLSLLKQNQIADKENVCRQHNKSVSNTLCRNLDVPAQRYIKELVESLIKGQSFISSTLEKQLCLFVENLMKRQNNHSTPLHKK